ncbi:iron-sulfur cluster assembly scaffold protein [Aurantiacibacter suaedae]|uniref:iron-sulfur cluster assembly scaffold protein n=1 Tax=Aurantiacibacter suaedae TaxID=2545755 RepID=UPI0014788E9D|nr:iron-sulfur cluster assembly scaffold protein [Aurantiacibacter suaedae]
MSAAKLYTPDLLAATLELVQYPPLENALLRGEARSPTCGSTLAIDLSLAKDSTIDRIGLTVRACAVGQASAAVFVRHAAGRSEADIVAVADRFSAWLDDEAPMPDWPDIALIAPAQAYPARHGAMLLPWKAAMAALSPRPGAR